MTSTPRMLPLDKYNQELLDNVHPEGWKNPEPADRYHLVVVGAGTAGLICAIGAAGLGARVALVERHLMGGDCLNVGCVPSKGIIRAARAWHAVKNGKGFGAPPASGDGDFAEAMRRMRRLRARISRADAARRYSEHGVDVFLGDGRFVGPGDLEVGGARLNFRRAVIATGARAAAPPIPGLEEAGYLTNETVFSLEERPERIVVIGAGPIGCEMSQAFARLGSRVYLLEMMNRILLAEDADAAEIVEKAMERDGVETICAAKIHRVEQRNGELAIHFECEGKQGSVAADKILVGVGRAPNVDGLGLEEAGVEYHKHGVKVDDRLRTTNPRIYAAGDIASRYKFTHAADAMARIVIANALFFGRSKVSRLVMPWCTYTSPEIAHVGMYEKEAQDLGYQVDTITVPLEGVDRAILDGEDEGFFRVHLKEGTDKILGATLVAERAGEMISEVTLAITAGVGLGKIGSTIHPFPTQTEVIRKAGDAWRRRKLTPKVKKLFSLYLSVFR